MQLATPVTSVRIEVAVEVVLRRLCGVYRDCILVGEQVSYWFLIVQCPVDSSFICLSSNDRSCDWVKRRLDQRLPDRSKRKRICLRLILYYVCSFPSLSRPSAENSSIMLIHYSNSGRNHWTPLQGHPVKHIHKSHWNSVKIVCGIFAKWHF